MSFTIFYDLLDNLKTELKADAIVNTVTTGDIFDVDLNKQTIFPLSHVMVNQATKQGNIWIFNITILAMDIVDKNSEATTDILKGNDDEHDVLNTQLGIAGRIIDVITKGSNKGSYDIISNPVCEPFTERFENYLAGWAITFDLAMPNTMTYC